MDVDNDGDLDVVAINSGLRWYESDGTPLYVLGSKGMELWQKAFVKPGVCYNFNSFSGFGENSLKLIKSA